MKSILDKSFVYTNAASTDLRKKFAAIIAANKKRKKATVTPLKVAARKPA